MTKTAIVIASALLVPSLCFADDRDSAPTQSSVPSDGWRVDATIGAADYPTISGYGTGVATSVRGGYEWMRDRVALGLGLELEVASFGAGGNMPFTSSAFNSYFALPTASAAYYGDHWLATASLGIGLGHETATGMLEGTPLAESDNMFALAGRVGIAYRITDRVAVGPYFRYAPCDEGAISQYLDFGLALAAH
jgi:opacity protein-like surface antigen